MTTVLLCAMLVIWFASSSNMQKPQTLRNTEYEQQRHRLDRQQLEMNRAVMDVVAFCSVMGFGYILVEYRMYLVILLLIATVLTVFSNTERSE